MDSTATAAVWEVTPVQLKSNNAATVAPAITNDSSQGYSVGSTWVDTSTGVKWYAVSVGVGAAVWQSDSPLGVGQVWTEVTPTRALGTTYTNTTGRAIVVEIVFSFLAVAGSNSVGIVVNGVAIQTTSILNSGSTTASLLASKVIPVGGTYSGFVSASGAVSRWFELR